jgi:RNA polymerase sigma factor (sigma-70 family)
MPPPASGLPARLVLGPALRAQSDGRLVRLVREGYESAFEEIVRRYRRPLDRFAAGIVGGRSEDVTQDSFRKALEALRHGDSDVELRPWLYRIVRNTALNDLRDRPPAAAELADELIGGARSAAAEAEERAEIAALTARLRALPENQRAALVMRELEGMSHEEIAASLGISGGAARQAIARARTAVRSGFGALVPLPLLRALAGSSDGAAEAVGAGAAGAGVAGSVAIGGGFGAGALKVGLATVAVAGSIGAGVAIDHHGGTDHPSSPRPAASAQGGPSGDGPRSTLSPVIAAVDDHGSRAGNDSGDDHGGTGPNGHGRDHRGHGGSGRSDDGHGSADASSGTGPSGGGGDGGSGRDGSSGDSHRGGPGPSGPDDSTSSGHSGSGSGDGDGSGHGGSGGDSGGSGTSGSGDGRSGSGSGSGTSHGSGTSGGDSRDGSGSGSSTSTRGGHGSDDAAETVVGTETAATSTSGGSESSSSGSGSSSSGSGSSDDSPTTSGDISSSSGSSGGPSPSLDSTIVTDDGSGSGGGSGSSGGS